MSTVDDAEHARAGNERAPMFERMQPFEKSQFEAMNRFDDDEPERQASPQSHSQAHSQAHSVALAPEGERRSIFNTLVTSDSDVVGLVAYSIYKQNKHDFLVAFGREHGREPDDAELSAYTLGEATPRRLATYRHLAEGTLAGRGPEAQPAAAPRASAAPAYAQSSAQSPAPVISTGTIVSLVTILVVIGFFIWLALRFGVIG
jgi:hypothetical protein